ncbi:MAG: DUF4391 domain-containing protein [Bacteroidetes bacterium]|nr:DUF4391 domain-containing protein [Bacteroidota bacterium]
MKIFELPQSTIVNRAIPKNSFDKFTNTKQKKRLSEMVDRIRWANKVSLDTVNLGGKDIAEIQLFDIRLKKKEDISDILTIIDRAIPYHIIFVLGFEDEIKYSASQKHPHPVNEDNTVIDWSFTSDWLSVNDDYYQLNLKQSLDFIFADFCKQLSGKQQEKLSLAQLIVKQQKIAELNKNIAELQVAIKGTRQFNKKVELNVELQKQLKKLKSFN